MSTDGNEMPQEDMYTALYLAMADFLKEYGCVDGGEGLPVNLLEAFVQAFSDATGYQVTLESYILKPSEVTLGDKLIAHTQASGNPCGCQSSLRTVGMHKDVTCEPVDFVKEWREESSDPSPV